MKEDDEAAIGSNLFYGSSMAEGNNSVYVLDLGRYCGKPVSEDGRYHIYQMKVKFIINFIKKESIIFVKRS